MSRWLAFYATPGTTATPTTSLEWEALDLANGGRLILALFHGPADAQAWVASVQGVIFLPRRQRVLGQAAVTVLAQFGVVLGDTVDAALEKIAAFWPHPGIWDHY
jgi:hypothetical protein